MSPIIALHLLAAVIWVGGLFFAYMILRPTAAHLEPPVRFRLWNGVFMRFFPWVWAAVIALPFTGYIAAYTLFGAMAHFPLHVHIMQGLGWVMILLYIWLFFVPWQGLREAIGGGELTVAGGHLKRIRRVVGLNLILGLIVVIVASGGRYY